MPNKILLVDDEDSNLRLLTQWLIPHREWSARAATPGDTAQ